MPMPSDRRLPSDSAASGNSSASSHPLIMDHDFTKSLKKLVIESPITTAPSYSALSHQGSFNHDFASHRGPKSASLLRERAETFHEFQDPSPISTASASINSLHLSDGLPSGRSRTTSTLSNGELVNAFGGPSMFSWQPESIAPDQGSSVPFSPFSGGADFNLTFGAPKSPFPSGVPSTPFSLPVHGAGGFSNENPGKSTSSLHNPMISRARVATATNMANGSLFTAPGNVEYHRPLSASSHSTRSEGTFSGNEYDSPFTGVKPWASDVIRPTPCLKIENVDPAATQADLAARFATFGAIQALTLTLDDAVCMITYQTAAAAYEAFVSMNGVKLGRFSLAISFAPQTLATGSMNGLGEKRSNILQVRSMTAPLTHLDMYSIFTPFGAISKCVVNENGVGMVQFAALEDAYEAKALDGTSYNGHALSITYSDHLAINEALRGTTEPTQYQEVTPSKKRYPPGLKISTPISTSHPVPHSAPIGKMNSFASALPVHVNESSEMEGISSAIPSTPLSSNKNYMNADFNKKIPIIPMDAVLDVAMIRDYRKKLDRDGGLHAQEFEGIYMECLSKAVQYCVDLNGNVMVQKVLEISSEKGVYTFVERIAPFFAAIATNKSGTWVIQKVIDMAAKSLALQDLVISAMRPYTCEMLMDTFGNYVVQGVLKLGAPKNQFILDAIKANCTEVALSRFGSRAMRTCLESQHVNKIQQKQIAVTIIQNCVDFAKSTNGAIVLTWLCDSSNLPGRYKVLSSKFKPHVGEMVLSKQALVFISKIQGQRAEPAARQELLESIFGNDAVLTEVLADREEGIPALQKLISSFTMSDKLYLSMLQDKLSDPVYADVDYEVLRKGKDFSALRLTIPASPAAAKPAPATAGIFSNNPFTKKMGASGLKGSASWGDGLSPIPSADSTSAVDREWRKF